MSPPSQSTRTMKACPILPEKIAYLLRMTWHVVDGCGLTDSLILYAESACSASSAGCPQSSSVRFWFSSHLNHDLEQRTCRFSWQSADDKTKGDTKRMPRTEMSDIALNTLGGYLSTINKDYSLEGKDDEQGSRHCVQTGRTVRRKDEYNCNTTSRANIQGRKLDMYETN